MWDKRVDGVENVVCFFQIFKLEELEYLKATRNIMMGFGNLEFGFQNLRFLNLFFLRIFVE